MKRLLFLLPVICFSFTTKVETNDEGRISTVFSGKIENWDVDYLGVQGNFEGYLMDDVNRWTFEVGTLSGEVNTEFNDQYNSWIITAGTKTYTMKTWISGSWYRWELSGGDLPEKTNIQTLYQGSYDNWKMSRDSIETSITTYTNNSWDDWSMTGDLKKMTDGEKVASMFIPVFVSRVYRKHIKN